MIAGFIVDTIDLFAVAWPRLLLFAMSLSLAVVAAEYLAAPDREG